MVSVHEAKSIAEARTVVELLEANEIPALVNVDVQGIVFPWQDVPKKGSARVLVPSTMLPMSRDIIRRAHPTAAPRGRSFPGARIARAISDKLPDKGTASMRAPLPAPKPPQLPMFGGADVVPFERVRPWEQPGGGGQSFTPEPADEDEGPIDLELPEPRPLAGRILIAMIAIAFGVALQRTFELFLGSERAFAQFGANEHSLSEVWRLVTAGFLHTSPEHLFANGVLGLLLGVVLFGTHEVGATVLVWLLASIAGMVAETSLAAAPLIVAGASAGNYGLVGLWANGQMARARRSLLPRWQFLRTLGLLVLLVPGALTPVTRQNGRVAVAAHVAGFLFGFMLGFVFHRRLGPEDGPRIERRSRYALMVAAIIVVPTLLKVALLLAG